MFRFLLALGFSICAFGAFAQMQVGADTLYGNEWIDYSKPYLKVKVGEDGLFRLPYQTIAASGWPISSVTATQLRIFRNGTQVPVYLTFTGPMGLADYIEFYGEKNQGEIDRYLWDANLDGRLNPEYSMYTDTAIYFLTWSDAGTPLRINAAQNDISNPPAAQPWAWSKAVDAPTSSAQKGRESDHVYFSWFNYEGFGGPNQQTALRTVALPGLMPQGTMDVSLRYLTDYLGHHVTTFINDSLVSDLNINGSSVQIINAQMPVLANANSQAKIKVVADLVNDYTALGAVTIRYPRATNANNASIFELETAPNGAKQYFEITNFNTTSNEVIVYNLTTNQRLSAVIDGNTVKFITPSANTAQRILIINPSLQLKTIVAAQSTQFVNYLDKAATYLFITHPALRLSANGSDPVQDFADYRSSAAGGSFSTEIVDINQLYDQYAYGLVFHPFSVRNFLHLYKKYHPQAEYVMMAGKGLEYKQIRTKAQYDLYADSIAFLPTYGTPPTDNMFVMGNRVTTPIMAIGRVTAVRVDQIAAYLEKVKQYEQLQSAPQTIEDRLWMKRILHLNGGGDDAPGIRNILNGFEARATTNKLGADVRTFESRTSDPVLLSGFDQIQNLFQDGMGLMTFMGHSSTTAVNFDLGQPSQYPISGKYPIFAVMGCYTGNCSNVAPSLGEQFILEPNRCAIAYFASTSFSFTDGLQAFGNKYYELLGGTGYGKSQGAILKNVVDDLQSTTSENLIAFLHQYQYQGDPAISMYAHQGPDYVIDKAAFKVNPNPVPVEDPNFEMEFDVVNIGQNLDSTIAIRIMQQMPNDTARLIKLDTISAPPNRSHFKYSFPSPGQNGVGFNRFFIKADSKDQVVELPATAEMNNDLLRAVGQEGVDVYFFSNDARPIWPKEYSIISNDTLTLYASTLSSTAAEQEYLFQLDTTPRFDSPLKKETSILSKAGLITWKPNIQMLDSTVYFWRIARDTLVVNAIPWRMSSFTHISGSPDGWDQSHIAQYMYNDLQTMEANDTLRKLEFADNAGYYWVDIGYRGIPVLYTGINNHLSENFLGEYGFNVRSTNTGLLLAHINPNTGKYVVNPVGYPANPSPTVNILYRVYDTRDSLQRIAAMQYIQDSIPTGHPVSIFMMSKITVDPTNGGYAPEKWAADSISYGTNLFQVLEAQGATQIRNLATMNNVPYGILYRQDMQNEQVLEATETSTTKVTNLRKDFLAKWDRGSMKSVLIGPAKSWKSAYWWPGAPDESRDEQTLEIYKIKEGQPDQLLATLAPGSPEYDLTQLNVAEYPYLRLKYVALDTINNTATDLSKWRVLYDGVPEGAIVPQEYLSFSNDTLQQGEIMKIGLAFRNISNYPMDSILVHFRTEDNAGGTQLIDKRLKPVIQGDSVVAKVEFDTRYLVGDQRIVIDYNFTQDQPELYHFNNVYIRPFYVVSDRINPALDVTFDGRHILNGDLISPKPLITIELNDENKLLAITDTANFRLFLTYPNGVESQIYFSSPDIQFIPAQIASGKNRATVEFKPYLTDDGQYALRVNGRDASGNLSAGLDYRVEFEVINKSSLSNIMNYPNPFSTSTCFFYTFTGLESPAQMLIRIMTVSGRVVREVSGAEFGQMEPGTHLSSFCWDGKDEFGDQLANGVYYYQVFAKKANGEAFDLFSNTQTDGFFKHGIGKMVLMR